MKVDAAMILKIPLLKEHLDDDVLWHYDKRGEYSVKSGYQLALRMKFPNAPSSLESMSQYWSALWSLELPEKIKIFMWRASNNLLPSTENMWKRKVIQEPTCQICRKSIESISHALLEYKAAKSIWLQSPFTVPSFKDHSQDIFSILQGMANELRKADLELMVALCWAVWFSRNKFIFEGKKIALNISTAKAKSILDAFQRVRKTYPSHIAYSSGEKLQKWIPPPPRKCLQS
ncbi:putative non-LTR reverse transcriptase [Citrus sinensis]|uniref:Non-LTR reverse transcriptase n=1 Tax=Citrus sinensis TaxID=2711 RepID=A0ACB8M764_CITSI|nr:putative non-LTR reverse transcriptase [Citrus sinensis]